MPWCGQLHSMTLSRPRPQRPSSVQRLVLSCSCIDVLLPQQFRAWPLGLAVVHPVVAARHTPAQPSLPAPPAKVPKPTAFGTSSMRILMVPLSAPPSAPSTARWAASGTTSHTPTCFTGSGCAGRRACPPAGRTAWQPAGACQNGFAGSIDLAMRWQRPWLVKPCHCPAPRRSTPSSTRWPSPAAPGSGRRCPRCLTACWRTGTA
jgi:hypothetical protein